MTLHEKIAQARLLADESAILKWITEASLSSSREMNFSEIEAHSIASSVRMGAVLALDKPCKVIPALAEALAIAVKALERYSGHPTTYDRRGCDCYTCDQGDEAREALQEMGRKMGVEG